MAIKCESCKKKFKSSVDFDGHAIDCTIATSTDPVLVEKAKAYKARWAAEAKKS